jgi:hypothetical protein
MTEIAGTAHIDDSKKNRHVVVEGVDENGAPAEKSYLIPFGQRIRIADGAQLEPGDILTEGFAYPQDILAIKGPIAVQNYLISEVQKVYRLQGVDICDKHIEVIVLQMMRKVRIEDAGSTKLIVGSSMDKSEFRDANEEIAARVAAGETDLKPARATSILLGITKASLATDSFLSAASFQETTRVLTDAAIKGKVDPLMGLKENVIIGKLIPAGTGIPKWKPSWRQGTRWTCKGPFPNSRKDARQTAGVFCVWMTGGRECASAPERVPLPGRTAINTAALLQEECGRGEGRKAAAVHQKQKARRRPPARCRSLRQHLPQPANIPAAPAQWEKRGGLRR